jgi:anti-sigma B factor antagonist
VTKIGKLHKTPEGLRVEVDGEVTYRTAPELRALLTAALQQQPDRLAVDLSRVPYMDSSGIAVLVESLQTQRKRGHRLVLCGLQPRVRGLFEISRLESLFGLPGVETAA